MSDTLVRLKTIGLDNHGNDKFANFAEMGLFVQRCGIGSVLMGTV